VAPSVESRRNFASRIIALRDGVVVRLNGRHLAVNAHVPQTAAETVAGRLKYHSRLTLIVKQPNTLPRPSALTGIARYTVSIYKKRKKVIIITNQGQF